MTTNKPLHYFVCAKFHLSIMVVDSKLLQSFLLATQVPLRKHQSVLPPHPVITGHNNRKEIIINLIHIEIRENGIELPFSLLKLSCVQRLADAIWEIDGVVRNSKL